MKRVPSCVLEHLHHRLSPLALCESQWLCIVGAARGQSFQVEVCSRCVVIVHCGFNLHFPHALMTLSIFLYSYFMYLLWCSNLLPTKIFFSYWWILYIFWIQVLCVMLYCVSQQKYRESIYTQKALNNLHFSHLLCKIHYLLFVFTVCQRNFKIGERKIKPKQKTQAQV